MPDSSGSSPRPFRVGILGGMGPLAGIELHKLIVKATPAAKDQDHMQVVLFTNPSIPDRTQSLQDDNGELFAAAAGASACELEKMDVSIVVMACMTAHARLQAIQAQTRVPILSGIPLVHSALRIHYPRKVVALLATSGSINSGVYQQQHTDINWLIPTDDVQTAITDTIYKIKGGSILSAIPLLLKAMNTLKSQGADVFVLGCTELGLLSAELQERSFSVIDPLELIAQQVVILHSLHQSVQARSIQQTKGVYNTQR